MPFGSISWSDPVANRDGSLQSSCPIEGIAAAMIHWTMHGDRGSRPRMWEFTPSIGGVGGWVAR